MKTIQLHGKYGAGRLTVVDDENFDELVASAWHVDINGYVRRYDIERGAKRAILMHRRIVGLGYGDEPRVDHRNGDPLDNRRGNLRRCTVAENNQNTRSRGGASQYRGVYWSRAKRRWIARVRIDGKQHNVGQFRDELEAGRAAQLARIELMPFAVEPVLL